MKYADSTIKKYIKDLGAKIPAPGGGSVAAFSAAFAASLLKMACLFTLGKEKYKKSGPRIRKIYARLSVLAERAVFLADEDIRAYRSKDMDKAVSVPVEVALLSFELVKLAMEVLRIGNKNLSSDALLAGLLADDSFIAALNYAEINLSTLEKNKNRFSAAVSRLFMINKQMRVMRKKLRG